MNLGILPARDKTAAPGSPWALVTATESLLNPTLSLQGPAWRFWLGREPPSPTCCRYLKTWSKPTRSSRGRGRGEWPARMLRRCQSPLRTRSRGASPSTVWPRHLLQAALLHGCGLEPPRQSLVLCALWPARAWEPLAGSSPVLGQTSLSSLSPESRLHWMPLGQCRWSPAHPELLDTAECAFLLSQASTK